MRFPVVPWTFLTIATALSACNQIMPTGRQTLPQSPATPSQSFGTPPAAFSGTVMDSPNEQTPKTTDSLEIAVSTGSTVETTVTADGTILTGDPMNPHRLTVFLDYDCLYCRRFLISDFPWIQSTMIRTNRLAVERIFVPMSQSGDNAARLALCAAKQEKFPDADHWLATHAISAIDTKKFARAIGLNLKKLTTCTAEKALLSGDEQKARDQNVERVPFFVLGPTSWLGLLSREELRRTIERALGNL